MSYLDWEMDKVSMRKEDLKVHFSNDLTWTADVSHKGVYIDTFSFVDGKWYNDEYSQPVVIQFVDEMWAEYMSSIMLGDSNGDVRASGRYTVRHVDMRFKADRVRPE